MFQCSSASRKFLNSHSVPDISGQPGFQCSSASRKFLNAVGGAGRAAQSPRFQCSSASRKFLNQILLPLFYYHSQKFQCSSASRKFLNLCRESRSFITPSVSVLFSEPKIPQLCIARCFDQFRSRFSALQRAENSSIIPCAR